MSKVGYSLLIHKDGLIGKAGADAHDLVMVEFGSGNASVGLGKHVKATK